MRFAADPDVNRRIVETQQLIDLVVRQYEKGNHIVDAGPEVGLFWGTDASPQPDKPLDPVDGVKKIFQYGGPSEHLHLMTSPTLK